jgi:NADH-quinone oxidoreductase subunit J
MPMLVIFLVLAFVAVGTAVSMLLTRNAVYSALFLVLNFGTVAILYLILGAPFIALTQITVYAGSVVVLFLFVIMLLGAERMPGGEPLRWQRLLAIPLMILLAGDFAYNIYFKGGQFGVISAPPEGYGAPQAIGKVLFTQFALPVEVTAIILLVAVVGAILLAKADAKQISRRELYKKQGEGK